MKKKRVLIYGWFGHENLGDELILKSIIETVKNSDDNVEVNVMGTKPKSIQKCHAGLNNVSTYIDLRFTSILRIFKYNPIQVIKNLFLNDYLVIGSGGALSDWNTESTITLFFMINFYKRVLKRPVMLLGVGAGPISKEESKVKFKKVLDQVDVISLRDKESYDLLRNIGLNNIKLTNDVVYDFKDSLKEDKKNGSSKKIGIVVAPLPFKTDIKKAEYIKSMVMYIEGIKKYNFEVKLIPFQYENDIEFLREIQEQVNIEIYEDAKNNVWSILDELNSYDLIVGMRFHSVVISILLNIPVIPIIYHAKVDSCVKDFKMESIAQYIGDGENWEDSNIDPEKMVKDTLNLIENLSIERDRLREILKNKFGDENKDIVKDFIRL